MYKLNGWKKKPKMESQADTYIERHFEKACQLLNNGPYILNEWRDRKRQYISYTSTTVFDFPHYSRHDVTHSVNILEAIELVLGKERIKKLSAGDLWLILESAYFHDIGMALCYKDLVGLWEDENFKKYIHECLSSAGEDYKDAAKWYTQMDNLVHDRAKLEGIENEEETEFGDTWPVELERRLLFLVADYIRKSHPELSNRMLERFSCETQDGIPKRLYQIVGNIALAHGMDYKYIESNLKYEEKGFGIDIVHPQFVAALLRLGDLLDMDNNRFNIRAMEHYGKLPASSEVHLKKHRAITHILITPFQISAEAVSGELEACTCTYEWFRFIEQEVINLVCHWNEMAPGELGGCVMNVAKCVVYYPHKPIIFNEKSQKRFEVDKLKLMDLLIGTNIYDIKMDFLREYIQNALDATKMQIWLDIAAGKYKYLINPAIIDMAELTPFDIPQSVYDEYALEIKVGLDETLSRVKIEIIDKGIGMESDCVDVLSKIGAGWRERKAYQDEIPRMLKWLRPTGGFGIGVQSAFMVTDEVKLKTKAEAESYGRKLTLISPRKSGRITEEYGAGLVNFSHGTAVELEMDLKYFWKWNREYEDYKAKQKGISTDNRKNTVQELLGAMHFQDGDMFERRNSFGYVVEFLKAYLENIVVNSPVPIRIINDNEMMPVMLRSGYLIHENYWEALIGTSSSGMRGLYYESRINDGDKSYRCICSVLTREVYIWNETEAVYTCIKILKAGKPQHLACFKNICVVRDNDFYSPYAQNFDMCIDFMGHDAGKALKVHRNAFNVSEEFQFGSYLSDSIRILLQFMKNMMEVGKRTKDVGIKEQLLSETARAYLWDYPVTLLNKLYFGEGDIRNTRLRDGNPLNILRIDIIENTAGNEGHVSYKFRSAENEVTFMLDQLEKFLDGRETDGLFFISRSFGRGEVANEISIKNQMVVNWLKKEKSSDEGKSKYAAIWKILDGLQKERFCVLKDSVWTKWMLESEKFEEKIFKFSERESDESESNYFSMLTWKKEKEVGARMSEQEFYRAMYDGESSQRYIAGMPDAAYHEKLQVQMIPYGLEKVVNQSGPYLISPIGENIRNEISLRLRVGRGGGVRLILDYEDFMELFRNKYRAEHVALLNWVYENQLVKGKYSRGEIAAEYEQLLKKIYKHSGLGPDS